MPSGTTILAIVVAYVAGNGVGSYKAAQNKLGQLGAEKSGLKELKQASDKLKGTLEGLKEGEPPPCEQIRREFDELKKRVEEAKLQGGIGTATSWVMDRGVKDLKEEIDKLCPP